MISLETVVTSVLHSYELGLGVEPQLCKFRRFRRKTSELLDLLVIRAGDLERKTN